MQNCGLIYIFECLASMHLDNDSDKPCTMEAVLYATPHIPASVWVCGSLLMLCVLCMNFFALRNSSHSAQTCEAQACCKSLTWFVSLSRPTLDGCPRSKFLGTNLDSLEVNWILWVGPYLASWFSKPWALLWAQFFLGSKPIDFPFKMVPCKFSLDLPLVGLGSSSKGRGSNLWLSANRICSISLDPRPWTLM
jgi:hypothetical protein